MNEIIKHIIDSLLAGVLVFLGALLTGHVDSASIITALIASGIIAFTKQKGTGGNDGK